MTIANKLLIASSRWWVMVVFSHGCVYIDLWVNVLRVCCVVVDDSLMDYSWALPWIFWDPLFLSMSWYISDTHLVSDSFSERDGLLVAIFQK